MVSALTRMLLRDLWHLRGQVLAAALVMACGIGMFVATQSTYHSLVVARATYYDSYRFADVFARLKRAPESLADEIRQIPGVAQVQTRVVMDVTLDVPGLAEPATGRLVSIPARQAPILNDLYLVRGRYVATERTEEVLASETFAKANGLDVGDKLGAVINGRWKDLTIVGIALSPEYIYEVGKGMLFPDNKRFGVLWMSREALGPAFSMEGAFNDVALSLTTGAEQAEVIARLDRLLERYGGLSAYGRSEQQSYRILDDELGELEIMTTFVPALFLSVAVFLLYIVLSRLVTMQRAQIGLLKAFGRSDVRVGLHYLQFAVVTVGLGLVLGVPSGLYLGNVFVATYRDYFHFPQLALVLDPGLLLIAVAISMVVAGVGALAAVRRAVALPPAEAMRPEPPARFRAGFIERAGFVRLLSSSVAHDRAQPHAQAVESAAFGDRHCVRHRSDGGRPLLIGRGEPHDDGAVRTGAARQSDGAVQRTASRQRRLRRVAVARCYPRGTVSRRAGMAAARASFKACGGHRAFPRHGSAPVDRQTTTSRELCRRRAWFWASNWQRYWESLRETASPWRCWRVPAPCAKFRWWERWTKCSVWARIWMRTHSPACCARTTVSQGRTYNSTQARRHNSTPT